MKQMLITQKIILETFSIQTYLKLSTDYINFCGFFLATLYEVQAFFNEVLTNTLNKIL